MDATTRAIRGRKRGNGMTLEEAIKHCEEVAEELEKRVKPYQCESINKKLYEVNKEEWDNCIECAQEHRQLAEWLREVKAYREAREAIKKHCGLAIEDRCKYCYRCNNVMGVKEILDLIDKYKEKASQPNKSENPTGWIPVTERLPKQQQRVLIQDFGQTTIGYLNAENRWRDLTNLDDYLKGVEAWMPLPEPYQSND